MNPGILSYLLQGQAIGLAASASPGPLLAYLISQTLMGGWRRGAWITLAPLISDAPIVIAVLLVLDQLSPVFLRAVSLIGGLYVLYLAWGLWRAWRLRQNREDAHAPALQPPESRLASLRKAVMMNFLSPGPYTFWAFINGPLLLRALRESPLHGAGFLFGFYGSFVGGMLLVVIVFHYARRLGPRLVSALNLASIVVFTAFGALLIVRGLFPSS